MLVEGGRNYEGENFLKPSQVDNEVMNRLLPLVIQDVIEGYRAQGPAAALTAGAVAAVGGGVGTFEPDEAQQAETAKNETTAKLREAGFPDFSMDFKENEDVRLRIGKMFDIPDEEARKLETIDAMREYLYERDVPVVMESRGVSETVAKQLVSQGISSALDPIYDRAQAARLEWMRKNREEAKQAADAGLLGTLSKEEREILGID